MDNVDPRDALKHALRLADAGYETTIRVDAQPDPLVKRVVAVRVLKASITDLPGFLRDAKDENLEIQHRTIEGREYFELS